MLKVSELLSPARRRQARFEYENPELPWLVPAAIREIESILMPDFVGFEWGAGRSTVWFAQRVAHITSVEGRREWYSEVMERIATSGLSAKVELVFSEVSTEYDFRENEIANYVGIINKTPDHSLDFIVVDGHFREACLEVCVEKLRKGGFLIIDNSDVVSVSVLEGMKASRVSKWNNGISETTLIQF